MFKSINDLKSSALFLFLTLGASDGSGSARPANAAQLQRERHDRKSANATRHAGSTASGLTTIGHGPLQSRRGELYRRGDRARRGATHRRTARSSPRPASTPAARPRTSSSSATQRPTRTVWWDNNKRDVAGAFRRAATPISSPIAAGRDLFVQDLIGGADREHSLPTRVVTEFAWHSLFIRNLLIRPDAVELASVRARADHHRPAVLPRRSGAPRHAAARP